MTQHDLDREVARATGETVTTIRRLGFSIIETDEPEPHMVDWEEMDDQRVGLFPHRKSRRRLPAAA